MTRIDLAYGQTHVPFEFPEDRFQILIGPDSQAPPLNDVEIGDAFDSPIDSPPLEEIVSSGDSVLIVVSDATRATASGQIVNLLIRRLIQYGVSAGDIAVIFATGIHRPVSAKEKMQLLTPFIAQRIRTIDHVSDDPHQLSSLGQTPNGTHIEVNRVLQEFSHTILTGGLAFHYFAGFTGGRKSVCPGLASARTIRDTHMLALDLQTGTRRHGVGTGLLDGNAVHEECDYIASQVNPLFSINTAVDGLGRAVQVYAGHWRTAHRIGCNEYAQRHSITISQQREFVVASCGGMPYDINLIQAHKTLDMATRACTEGGTIILLAACSEGFGRSDFVKWFDSDSRSLANRLKSEYEVNGQTAWALLTKIERYRIVLVSELPDADVRQMGMFPSHSFEEALREVSSTTLGYVLPNGPAFLPVVV